MPRCVGPRGHPAPSWPRAGPKPPWAQSPPVTLGCLRVPPSFLPAGRTPSVGFSLFPHRAQALPACWGGKRGVDFVGKTLRSLAIKGKLDQVEDVRVKNPVYGDFPGGPVAESLSS